MINKNKKRNIILLICLVLLLAIGLFIVLSLKKSDKYTLKGQLKNGEDKYLILVDYVDAEAVVLDTIELNSKGEFSVKEKMGEPSLLRLQGMADDYIVICPSAGEKIRIEGDYRKLSDTYTIEGSKESEGLHSLIERQKKMGEELRKIQGEYDLASPETKQIIRRELSASFVQMMREEQDFLKKYIEDNKGSLTTIIALYSEFMDLPLFSPYRNEDVYKQVLEGLESKYPSNRHTRSLQSVVKKIEQSKQSRENQDGQNTK